MNRRLKLALTGVVLAFACGPGSDVNGFPSALAAAYCHFAYHCCTPVERQTFPSGFAQEANTLSFDNESDCNSKLSTVLQNTYQDYQASVKDKRMSWSQTNAQACLTAVNNASSKCDAQAFQIASSGDPTTPTVAAVCATSQFLTGLVAASGVCTIAADCAGTGSACTPPTQTGGTQVVQAGGTCTPLPIHGQNCPNNACAPGDSCCNAGVCVAFQAQGSVCTRAGFFGTCSSQPCNDTDYCGYTNNAYSCLVKIAGGQPCGVDQAGQQLADSCVSGQCNNGSCTAPVQPTYKICTGNPDGI